jgi:hypothetical protein
LRSHPLAWRVTSLVAAVTAATVGLGTIRIQAADGSAVYARNAGQLASLAGAVTRVTEAIEDEQSDFAIYVGEGRPASESTLLLAQGQVSVTNLAENQLDAVTVWIGPALRPQQRAELASVMSLLKGLPQLRQSATSTLTPALQVIEAYSATVTGLFTADAQMLAEPGDPVLARGVRSLSALQQAEEAAAQERSILNAALAAGQFQAGEVQALSAARSRQQADLAQFDSEATAGQQRTYSQAVAAQPWAGATVMLDQALGSKPGYLPVTLPPGSPFPTVQLTWNNEMTFAVDQMRSVGQDVLASITARGQELHAQAIRVVADTLLEMAAVILVVVALAVTLTRRRSRSAGVA